MSLRIGLGTFSGPDSVHAQHLCKIRSIGYSTILLVASDKHPVLAWDTGLWQWLITRNRKCMYATISTSKSANCDLTQAYIGSLIQSGSARSKLLMQDVPPELGLVHVVGPF